MAQTHAEAGRLTSDANRPNGRPTGNGWLASLRGWSFQTPALAPKLFCETMSRKPHKAFGSNSSIGLNVECELIGSIEKQAAHQQWV
jgi:hypothetical protein